MVKKNHPISEETAKKEIFDLSKELQHYEQVSTLGFEEAQADNQDIVIFCSNDVSSIKQDSQFLMEDFNEQEDQQLLSGIHSDVAQNGFFNH